MVRDTIFLNKYFMSKLKVITLFSGYGSQELALKYLGVNYEVIANCDILKRANLMYDKLHETKLGNLGDIKKINEKEFPSCDLLTFSFPCQDLSLQGVQRGIKKGTRSGLLLEVERIIGYNKPKYLFMENVKNLVNKRHIGSFNKFIKNLEVWGYGNHWVNLNAADYGCPQNRERIFMVSILNESSESVKGKVEEVLKYKTDRLPMKTFLEQEVSEEYLLKNIEYDIRECKRNNSVCKLVGNIHNVKFEQRSRIYSYEGGSPCLDATEPPNIVDNNGKVRKISPREAYRFMGIKDLDIDKMLEVDISWKNHTKLAGNSICIPVMEQLFKTFIDPVYIKSSL